MNSDLSDITYLLPESPSFQNEAYYRALLDSLFEAIYTVDPAGVITSWNASCERLTGYTAGEMIGRNYESSPIAWAYDGRDDRPARRSGILRTLENQMPIKWKGAIIRKNGQPISVKSHISPIRLDNGKPAGAVEVFRDMTSQIALQQAHQEVLEVSRRDLLTGLYNRCALVECMRAEIDRSRRYLQPLSVILADIDHFKRVNDHYGHEIGDIVLSTIAGVLAAGIRQPDTVGRWGGEEFLIITPNSDATAAVQLAQRLRQRIAQEHFPGCPEKVTASFGVSTLTSGQNLDQVLYVADHALYQAKALGRNRVAVGASTFDSARRP